MSDLVRRNVRHRGSGAQVLAGGSVRGLPPVLEKSGPGCHVYTMKNRPLVLRLAAAAFFAPLFVAPPAKAQQSARPAADAAAPVLLVPDRVFDAPTGLVRTGWVVLVRGGASSGDVNFRACFNWTTSSAVSSPGFMLIWSQLTEIPLRTSMRSETSAW